MTTNPLTLRWQAGDVTYGIGLTVPSAAVAQLLAHAGFDWLMIDLEHGPVSIESAHAMIAATAGTDVVPLVRIPQNLGWLAKPALDAGATGIVYPQINSRDDAAAAARSTRYPPDGDRQWGPFYAPARHGLTLADYLHTANDAVVTIVLVEHPDAIEDIEEIVATHGVDAAVIGTHDLAVSMGRPGQPDHPDVRGAVARAEKVILDGPVVLGGNALSPQQARQMADRGYQLLTLGFDWTLLQHGAAAALTGARRTTNPSQCGSRSPCSAPWTRGTPGDPAGRHPAALGAVR
ncbi:HpcH/HpaI aldolase family protein [Pseudonocardia saturnea]